MKYLVVIERARDRSYSAYLPDIPGCVACGSTPEVVKRRIREALALHLEAMREDGLPIPPPAARSTTISAPAQTRKRRRSAAQ